jgi:prolipoprotein diacylglyceryltransferase
VTFKDTHSLGVYPAQIISSLNGLILFLLLLFLFKRKKFDGQIASLALMFYSITRFLIEFIRVEPNYFINVSQWIAIVTFGLSIYLYQYAKKKNLPEKLN